MRNPPGDGADQRSTRRRDQIPESAGRPGRPPAAGSVFAPGYDASRPESGDPAGPRASSPGTTWYGSTAGGAAGKGPVRGYPPVPGQPPPVYPPGQFAAWNRPRPRQDRVSQPGQPPGPPSGPEPPRTSGPHAALGAQAMVRSGLDQPHTGYPGPPRPAGQTDQDYPASRAPGAGSASGSFPHIQPAGPGARQDTPATSRYYDQDLGTSADPGYPMLAVSDPAADVTSTQTWQAVGEGRATGVWTAPTRRDGLPAASSGRGSVDATDAPASPRRTAAFDTAGRDTVARDSGSHLRDSGSHLRDPAGYSADAGDAPDRIGDSGRRSSRGHSGAHTSPHQIPRSQRRAGGLTGAATPMGPAGPKPRRPRPASVRLAIAAAVVFVLAAATALSYAVLHHSPSPKVGAAAASKPASSATVSASPTPSLGQYGHIASRAADPTPLTMSELYPASFTVGGASVVRTAASKGTSCASELVGSTIQSAIGSAGCNQVVRATYLASTPGVMGTIGVLNLSTAKAATTVAKAADANDFISQLAGKHGATTKIGQGTGIEEAAAKGHYLILIWAEFTDLRKPQTNAQRMTIEQFMTELLQNTANVSLTNRMLTGTP